MGSDYEIEKLSGEEAEEYPEKTEIKDGQSLECINEFIKPLLNAVDAFKNKAPGALFKVIIPKGKKLIEEKGPLTGDQAVNIANLIVAQYNMSQINGVLTEISSGLSRIEKFQEAEYKSKVLALMMQIEKLTKYQFDIINDSDRRKAEILKLDTFEHKCIELLVQANLTIERDADRKYRDYEDYCDTLYEAQNWFDFRKSLYSVLYKIEELRYTFGLGELSREFCFEIMNSYKNQIEAVQEKVVKWHQKAIKEYGIDFEKHRRRRDGWDAAFKWLPGLFDDDSNYKNMMQKTLDLIKGQQEPFISEQISAIDPYNEDIQLIIDEEKAYYLPKKGCFS